jgi:hypothetical protein
VVYRFDRLEVRDPEAGGLVIDGDGFASAGEPATLLANPRVQQFLGMSGTEAAAAAEIVREYRDSLKGAYAHGAWQPPRLDPATLPFRSRLSGKVEALLGPARAARLRRLSWRISGADALLEPEVADALGLSSEQRRNLAATARSNESDHQQLLSDVRAVRMRNDGSLEDRARKNDLAGQTKLMAILTDEQRTEFTRLLGEHNG